MKIPDELRYTEEHEWVRVADDEATVGITDYAQSELGDVVFVELPKMDRELERGDRLASVESVKAVSEVYAPVSGRVTAVNTDLVERPELLNQSPYEEGWMARMKLSDPSELGSLMSAAQYAEFVAQEKGRK